MKTSTLVRTRRIDNAVVIAPPSPAVPRRDDQARRQVHPEDAAAGSTEKPLEQGSVYARLIVGPLESSDELIDVTHDVIGLIARAIWQRNPQSNDLLNWMEAERLFQQAMSQCRAIVSSEGLQPDRHGR